jgi:hypothetical protein
MRASWIALCQFGREGCDFRAALGQVGSLPEKHRPRGTQRLGEGSKTRSTRAEIRPIFGNLDGHRGQVGRHVGRNVAGGKPFAHGFGVNRGPGAEIVQIEIVGVGVGVGVGCGFRGVKIGPPGVDDAAHSLRYARGRRQVWNDKNSTRRAKRRKWAGSIDRECGRCVAVPHKAPFDAQFFARFHSVESGRSRLNASHNGQPDRVCEGHNRIVTMSQTIFHDVAGVKGILAYKGAQFVSEYAPELDKPQIRAALADEGYHGDFSLKCRTLSGVQATPVIPLHVPRPAVTGEELDQALTAATISKANGYLESSTARAIEAERNHAAADYQRQIATLEGQVSRAREDAESVRAELAALRATYAAKIAQIREDADADAQRRVRTIQDRAELDADRAKLTVENARERAAAELHYEKKRMEAEIEHLTRDLARERREREQARRELDTARDEQAAERRATADEIAKLKARINHSTSPGVQRVAELGEIARLMQTAPDEQSRNVLMQVITSEAGLPAPSKMDLLIDAVTNSPEILGAIGRVVSRITGQDAPAAPAAAVVTLNTGPREL